MELTEETANKIAAQFERLRFVSEGFVEAAKKSMDATLDLSIKLAEAAALRKKYPHTFKAMSMVKRLAARAIINASFQS